MEVGGRCLACKYRQKGGAGAEEEIAADSDYCKTDTSDSASSP